MSGGLQMYLQIKIDAVKKLIMHPAMPNKARRGRVPFIFAAHSDLYQVTTRELFTVTMYTAHISSNGSQYLMA